MRICKKFLVTIIFLFLAQLAHAEPQEAPYNWPCVQRYVPELSAATIWPSPLVDIQAQDSSEAKLLSAHVEALANRRVNLDDAKVEADGYLSQRIDDQALLASELFARVFAQVQTERHRVIKGIFRYTDRQRMLANRIEKQRRKLEDGSNQGLDAAEREDLEARQRWDIRAFREREQQLNYLCEQPVNLEQRLFAVARYLQGYLQQ